MDWERVRTQSHNTRTVSAKEKCRFRNTFLKMLHREDYVYQTSCFRALAAPDTVGGMSLDSLLQSQPFYLEEAAQPQ